MEDEHAWRPPRTPLDSTRPLYEQFANMVRSALANGSLRPGQRLPSVRDFAAHFRVNPNTVMRTYQDLEREGFIQTFRGQGTYVLSDPRLIQKSRRILARSAYAQLDRTAASLGISVAELLELAQTDGEDEG